MSRFLTKNAEPSPNSYASEAYSQWINPLRLTASETALKVSENAISIFDAVGALHEGRMERLSRLAAVYVIASGFHRCP